MSNKEHGNTLWKASCALFLALNVLLLSLFFSGQLQCDISTIMSLHQSYPNHTNGYDNHTHDNQSLMTLKVSEMPQLKFNEIHQLWNIHFIHSFIESKLNHTFKYKRFYAQSQSSTVKLATEKSTGSLLAITNAVLKNLMDNSSNHTNTGNTSSIANSMHHKLLQIYRSIIILCSHSNVTCTNQSLTDTLSTIAELYHHIATPDRAYYNIHMSRSAGTTICATFKVNGVTIPKHNCNIPGGRAFFFNRDQGQTSCAQKRSIQKTYGYKLVAAERPMHGNGVASHPELCDDFIYILSFRYPIERILSFIDMYTNMFASTMNKVNIFPARKKSKAEEDRAGWVEKWNLTKNQDIFYRYFVKHEFDKHWSSAKSDAKYRIQGYMNNAVTRWIGYEWKQKQVYNATKRLLMGDIEKTDTTLNSTKIALRVRNSIFKSRNRTKFRRPDPSYFSYRSRGTSRKTGFDGLKAPIQEINENDIHFYNAMEYLMKVDYVLPFSSLQADDKINSRKIWNKLLKDICKYLGLDEDKYFQEWEHKGDRTTHRKNLVSYLSDKDIEALHEYNNFDFKLYELAKYISEADLRFDAFLYGRS